MTIAIAATAVSAALVTGCGGIDDVPPRPPAVGVESPPASPLWAVGTTRTISWGACQVDRIRIDLLRGGAGPAELIADDVDASLGAYDWVVTGPPSAGNMIVITDMADANRTDQSDPFDIVPAGIHVLSPVPGTYFSVGGDLEVMWLVDAATVAGVTDVRIEISRDNGGTWVEDIVATTGVGAGTYTWTVTDGGVALPQNECLVRVSDAAAPAANDVTGPLYVFSGICHVDVDAPAGGDGLSWATAFQHPQDAMDVVPPGSEVWVAEGTYTRRDVADTVVLSMPDGVAVYGGFAGTESVLGDRDWDLHPTILDGADVCEHVVVAGDLGRLDGLTAKKGNPSASSLYRGGGVYCRDVDFVVENCILSESEAGRGGGLFASGGSVTISNSQVRGNIAGTGGGICCEGGAQLALEACVLADNSGTGRGGGVYAIASQVSLDGCMVLRNASSSGGGLSCDGAVAQVASSIFSGNTASSKGGAIWDGNLSAFGGSCTVTNCTIAGNTAGAGGGGGVLSYGSPALDIVNCIIWGNTAGLTPYPSQITVEDSGVVAVSYSDIEGDHLGSGNIDANPLFVDADGTDDIVGTEDDDLRLQSASPCIDAADPATTLTDDIDGNPRPAGSGYDMGAYEYQP
jgi:hypothetical protein